MKTDSGDGMSWWFLAMSLGITVCIIASIQGTNWYAAVAWVVAWVLSFLSEYHERREAYWERKYLLVCDELMKLRTDYLDLGGEARVRDMAFDAQEERT